MALGCSDLIAEVKELVGRGTNVVDSNLITNDRVMQWLNQAQEIIVEECADVPSLKFKNITSVDTTQKLSYPFSDLTSSDWTAPEVAYIADVFYLNGTDSVKLNYVFTDEFDVEFPDPTHSDFAFDKPHWWTQRNKTIEIVPLCATAYHNKTLRIDGIFYAKDFSSTTATRVSDITRADEWLVYFSVAQAFAAIGDKPQEDSYTAKFNQWQETYKNKQTRLHMWEGNLYSDDL